MNRKHSNNFVVYISVTLAFFVVSIFLDRIHIVAKEQVGTVSQVGATIEETPINKLAVELREYSKELSAKELALNQRELALNEEAERVRNSTRNILVGAISMSLITLLLMNYYMRKRSNVLVDDKFNNRGFEYSKAHIHKGKFHMNIQNYN